MSFRDLNKAFTPEWSCRKRRNNFHTTVRDRAHNPYSTIFKGVKLKLLGAPKLFIVCLSTTQLDIYAFCYSCVSGPDPGLLPQTQPES